MEFTEKKGKDLDVAIESALKELDAVREDVEVEILEEGSKGIMGIGGVEAHVRVSIKVEAQSDVNNMVTDLLHMMNLRLTPGELSKTDEDNYLEIEGEDAGILIGREGRTLDAFQYIVNVLNYRSAPESKRTTIDIEGYREKKRLQIIRLAEDTAERVLSEGDEVRLEHLNAADRRIVHLTLQENNDVETYSEGERQERVLIVARS